MNFSGKACWYDFLKKIWKWYFLKKEVLNIRISGIVLFQSTQEDVNCAPMWTKPAVRRACCLLLNAAFQLESTKSTASVLHVYRVNSPRGHFLPSSCLRSQSWVQKGPGPGEGKKERVFPRDKPTSKLAREHLSAKFYFISDDCKLTDSLQSIFCESIHAGISELKIVTRQEMRRKIKKDNSLLPRPFPRWTLI